MAESQKRAPATAKRSGVAPSPGARFAEQVLAENIRTWRGVRRLTQEELASRMTALGHPWSAGIVGFVERNDRAVRVNELLALALVLEVFVSDLLDPAGVDGRGQEPLDYGGRLLPAIAVRHWLANRVRVGLGWTEGEPGIHFEPVDGVTDAATESIEAYRIQVRKRS